MRSLFLSDEELGKKDDDHKTPKNGSLRPANWNAARAPPRRSLKRIGLLLFVAAVIYLFIKNVPVLGPNAQMRRPNYVYPETASSRRPPPKQVPQYAESIRYPAVVQERTFNGPVKFHELAASLHAIAGTRGSTATNRNVLFAVSSLKSAAMLLPVACEMATELKNYVHFALLSRSDIELQDLRSLNGIDNSCQIIFHDARPDYVTISTDERLENAAFRAFHHINNYMHPQAIMVDGSNNEEGFFTQAVRQHVKATGNTLIELPQKSTKSLSWMTRLDSQALRMWDKIHIDILIHATPGASGSLIRLLRSLNKADYTSSSVPHLTIDLPHDIDPPTKRFLETFSWPPPHAHNPTNARLLSLRHRIPHQRMTEDESSVRFLESFWPAQPEFSHILVLSPQVELSPHYYHYLKYSLLEYRYSTVSTFQHWDRRLFGISLEQPLTLLNDEKPWTPPLLLESSDPESGNREMSTPFLWQAPSSNAVLFLGEKWMELHDFVSRSMEAKERFETLPAFVDERHVSMKYPAWLEHALRLCRVRAYWLLYPGEDASRNLASVHHELSHFPEEYAQEEGSKPLLHSDATEAEVDRVRQKLRSGSEIQLSPTSLLESLSNDGNLKSFGDLPIVTWDGITTEVDELKFQAADYTAQFKRIVGGCDVVSSERQKERASSLAQDLFCNTE
ncbi:hypothetical protein F5Y15DRAFT_417862 [Xylariaceae sp. FL0016]|nr:hypothetical protein F5Y15DRAFT_417862 [Xylariaceae sp. FL0016]